MELDLCFNFGCDDWNCKHVCKVLRQSRRVDPLNIATSEVCKPAQRFNIALVSFNRDNINCDTGFLGNLSYLSVEIVCLNLLLLGHDLIEGTKADISKTVSADDDDGASGTLTGHCD